MEFIKSLVWITWVLFFSGIIPCVFIGFVSVVWSWKLSRFYIDRSRPLLKVFDFILLFVISAFSISSMALIATIIHSFLYDPVNDDPGLGVLMILVYFFIAMVINTITFLFIVPAYLYAKEYHAIDNKKLRRKKTALAFAKAFGFITATAGICWLSWYVTIFVF